MTEPQEEAADGKAVYTGPEEAKEPTGAVRQGAPGQDVKGRAMRTADPILTILPDRGKRTLPLDDVYRPLSHPAMALRSYAKVYKNQGAMPPGSTAETVDGMSMAKIAEIIEASRQEKWHGTPVRRVLKAKPSYALFAKPPMNHNAQPTATDADRKGAAQQPSPRYLTFGEGLNG